MLPIHYRPAVCAKASRAAPAGQLAARPPGGSCTASSAGGRCLLPIRTAAASRHRGMPDKALDLPSSRVRDASEEPHEALNQQQQGQAPAGVLLNNISPLPARLGGSRRLARLPRGPGEPQPARLKLLAVQPSAGTAQLPVASTVIATATGTGTDSTKATATVTAAATASATATATATAMREALSTQAVVAQEEAEMPLLLLPSLRHAPVEVEQCSRSGLQRLVLQRQGWHSWQWRGHRINWLAAGTAVGLGVGVGGEKREGLRAL